MDGEEEGDGGEVDQDVERGGDLAEGLLGGLGERGADGAEVEVARQEQKGGAEQGGDGARPPDSTQKIVLNKDSAAGGKKKGGCC